MLPHCRIFTVWFPTPVTVTVWFGSTRGLRLLRLLPVGLVTFAVYGWFTLRTVTRTLRFWLLRVPHHAHTHIAVAVRFGCTPFACGWLRLVTATHVTGCYTFTVTLRCSAVEFVLPVYTHTFALVTGCTHTPHTFTRGCWLHTHGWLRLVHGYAHTHVHGFGCRSRVGSRGLRTVDLVTFGYGSRLLHTCSCTRLRLVRIYVTRFAVGWFTRCTRVHPALVHAFTRLHAVTRLVYGWLVGCVRVAVGCGYCSSRSRSHTVAVGCRTTVTLLRSLRAYVAGWFDLYHAVWFARSCSSLLHSFGCLHTVTLRLGCRALPTGYTHAHFTHIHTHTHGLRTLYAPHLPRFTVTRVLPHFGWVTTALVTHAAHTARLLRWVTHMPAVHCQLLLRLPGSRCGCYLCCGYVPAVGSRGCYLPRLVYLPRFCGYRIRWLRFGLRTH